MALLIGSWVILMGGPPINDSADIVVGLVQQALMIAVNLWAAWPRREVLQPSVA